MSKWVIALAASIVVIGGCSGGGGGNNGGGGGGAPGDSTAFATIPNVPGLLQNVYLTGQGRAQGDPIAVLRRVTVDDAGGQIQTLLNPFLRLQLNGYTHQFISMNIPTTTGRTYDHYNLEIHQLDIDNGDGTYTTFGNGNQPLFQFQGTPFYDPVQAPHGGFPANFRMFPGRQTSITVRLDDSMFVPDGASYSFDVDQFQVVNNSSVRGGPEQMNGFLSDYVAFDLTNLQDTPPDFPDASGTASMLYVDGDNFALGTHPDGPPGQATADPKPFFVLTPQGYVSGLHVGERTEGGAEIPGTYSLVQIDPRDPFNPAAQITALQGTYKSFYRAFAGFGANAQGFEVFAFPSTFDDGFDDVVMFNVTGNEITHLYFGWLDMDSGEIHGFPLVNITDPSNTTGEITGTISNLDSADFTTVHSGHYTLDPTNLPPTFSTSGRFIVYRR